MCPLPQPAPFSKLSQPLLSPHPLPPSHPPHPRTYPSLELTIDPPSAYYQATCLPNPLQYVPVWHKLHSFEEVAPAFSLLAMRLSFTQNKGVSPPAALQGITKKNRIHKLESQTVLQTNEFVQHTAGSRIINYLVSKSIHLPRTGYSWQSLLHLPNR